MPIEDISLWPELSSPPYFRIQGGYPERDGRMEILVSNIGWLSIVILRLFYDYYILLILKQNKHCALLHYTMLYNTTMCLTIPNFTIIFHTLLYYTELENIKLSRLITLKFLTAPYLGDVYLLWNHNWMNAADSVVFLF